LDATGLVATAAPVIFKIESDLLKIKELNQINAP
jgi:hypothetical protein